MKGCSVILLTGVIASISLQARGTEPRSGSPSQLAAILEREADGQSVDRSELLESTSLAEDGAAAWHAGRFKVGDRWCTVDELTSSGVADAYRSKRQELEGDPQRHYKLARWCAQHGYPDQARAHFYGVLIDAPNHAEARKALGHVQIGDQWIDSAELKAAQAKMKQMFAQLDEWVPELADIAKGLQSHTTAVKTRALEDLDKIDAAKALPALEMFAVNVDDDLAMPMIRKIAGVRSRDACQALVRIALAHPSAAVRRKASETIRTYPEPSYVPDLLGILSGEIEVENRLVMQPNGHIGLTTLVQNELQNRKQLQRFEKHVKVVSAFSFTHTASAQIADTQDQYLWSIRYRIPKSNPIHLGNTVSRSSGGNSTAKAAAVYVPAEVASAAADNLRQQGKEQEYAANRQNRSTKEQTHSVCGLLRETTGQTIGDEPKSWWSWWTDRYERYESAKPTTVAYHQQQQQIAITSRAYTTSTSIAERDLGKALVQWSCLVPGTLVQTERGLVPIEKIQIGDRVLSQDPETAELALKPVLLTTIRAPKPTLKIVTEDNTIEATGGHLWWVSGHGWTKSRDLQPGMMLHTATGNVEVQKITENSTPQQTHNLVVDGFHTYFVGPERVLSYDNSQLKPCLHTVPGFGVLADAR